VPGQRARFSLGAAAIPAAIVTGLVVSRSPAAAAIGVLAVLLAVGALVLSRTFIVTALVAVMPWMVIFNDLLPALVKTFTSAAATIALCLYVMPSRSRSPWLPLGISVFIAMTLYGLSANPGSLEAIQASKYMVFPFLAFAVTSTNARERLSRLRKPVLVSTGLAALTQLGIIILGLGSIGTYYHVGERLGFDGRDPLELGLLAVIIACAGLATAQRTYVRAFFLAVGLVAAYETGNRATLLASLLVVAIFLFSSRFEVSRLFVVLAVAGVLVGGGVLSSYEHRFANEVQSGEFSTFATAGSGRGKVYTVALRHWLTTGPSGLVIGTGLGSIPQFEKQAIGIPLFGHSDILETAIELGIIGFLGWITIWFVLLADASLSRILLVPIAVFSAITGALTATAPLVVGFFFAAASPRVAISDLLPARAVEQSEPELTPPTPALTSGT
jgi:hypothetical protein